MPIQSSKKKKRRGELDAYGKIQFEKMKWSETEENTICRHAASSESIHMNQSVHIYVHILNINLY